MIFPFQNFQNIQLLKISFSSQEQVCTLLHYSLRGWISYRLGSIFLYRWKYNSSKFDIVASFSITHSIDDFIRSPQPLHRPFFCGYGRCCRSCTHWRIFLDILSIWPTLEACDHTEEQIGSDSYGWHKFNACSTIFLLSCQDSLWQLNACSTSSLFFFSRNRTKR